MVHRICIIPGIMGHPNGPSCLRQTPYLGASTTFHFGVFRIDRIDSVHGNWGMSHLNFYSLTSAPLAIRSLLFPPLLPLNCLFATLYTLGMCIMRIC